MCIFIIRLIIFFFWIWYRMGWRRISMIITYFRTFRFWYFNFFIIIIIIYNRCIKCKIFRFSFLYIYYSSQVYIYIYIYMYALYLTQFFFFFWWYFNINIIINNIYQFTIWFFIITWISIIIQHGIWLNLKIIIYLFYVK